MHHFAKHLGLTVEQYHKFSSAYGLNNTSKYLPEFIDLRAHPAFRESLHLTSLGERIPQSLLSQIENASTKNQEKFAEYMQMSVREIKELQRRYAEMLLVVESLENIRTNRNEESEIIRVFGSEEQIKVAMSGEYTGLVVAIFDSGLASNYGRGSVFNVDFEIGGNEILFGQQQWWVDRFSAYPVEQIHCENQACELAAVE